MKILKKILILSLIGIFLPSLLCLQAKLNDQVSVNTDKSKGQIKVARILAHLSINESANGIILLPEQVPPVIRNVFNRYTRVTAPNGKPIHLLAQAGWTEDQILKARNVLQHLLTDYPDSVYGSNKTAVANAMADKNAAMVLFNTAADLDSQ
jgi:hypothetical protein